MKLLDKLKILNLISRDKLTNERELKIIEQIKANKKMTSGEIQNLFNVRRKAANSYLQRLIDLKLIKRMGSGKAVYYVLPQHSLHCLAFPLRFLYVTFASHSSDMRRLCVNLKSTPMFERQSFQNKNLVLKVSPNYDPNKEQNNG